jgi:hypothetical protein
MKTKRGHAEYRWVEMKGAEVVADRTYIWFSDYNGIVLPRHGFERGEDYEAARNFVVSKLPKHP